MCAKFIISAPAFWLAIGSNTIRRIWATESIKLILPLMWLSSTNLGLEIVKTEVQAVRISMHNGHNRPYRFMKQEIIAIWSEWRHVEMEIWGLRHGAVFSSTYVVCLSEFCMLLWLTLRWDIRFSSDGACLHIRILIGHIALLSAQFHVNPVGLHVYWNKQRQHKLNDGWLHSPPRYQWWTIWVLPRK